MTRQKKTQKYNYLKVAKKMFYKLTLDLRLEINENKQSSN